MKIKAIKSREKCDCCGDFFINFGGKDARFLKPIEPEIKCENCEAMERCEENEQKNERFCPAILYLLGNYSSPNY